MNVGSVVRLRPGKRDDMTNVPDVDFRIIDRQVERIDDENPATAFYIYHLRAVDSACYNGSILCTEDDVIPSHRRDQ